MSIMRETGVMPLANGARLQIIATQNAWNGELPCLMSEGITHIGVHVNKFDN
jgi:uncharacterized protein YjhX (UPF0386 family)